MLAKKTLELNPHHPVIKEMLSKVKNQEEVDEEVQEYGTLLYNMALLNSGFLIENPTEFIVPMQKLLKVGFGLRKDAPVEEIEVDISSSTEEEQEQEKEKEEEPDTPGDIEVEDATKEDL